jgi:hypothetical protein
MRQAFILSLMAGVLMWGMTPAAWTAEQNSSSTSSMGHKTMAASPPATQSGVAAHHAAAALPPQAVTTRGTITALDLRSTSPTLKFTDASGKVWTLALDPQATMVWKDGKSVRFDGLRVGEQAQIRHVVRDGKDVAASIQITQALSSSGAHSRPVTTSAPRPTTSTPKSY